MTDYPSSHTLFLQLHQYQQEQQHHYHHHHYYNQDTMLFTLVFIIVTISNVESSVIKVGYLTNMQGFDNQQRQGLVISGAITYAIEKVNHNTSKLNGNRIELIANDTLGSTLLGSQAILEQWRNGTVAFFGPEDSCETEATIASAINLPMISYKCADSKASNKHFYKTFVRTHPSDTQIVSSVIALLQSFKWRKFSIVTEKSTQYLTVARNLADKAKALNLTINSESRYDDIYLCCRENKPCCNDPLYNIIQGTYKRTRIYVFMGNVLDLITMMQVMYAKSLINNGYVLIYVDLDQYRTAESFRYFWRRDMDASTKKIMLEAAKSLLVVVTSPPDSSFQYFENQVREYNLKPPFNLRQPFPEFKKHITVYASYLYDAFMLYADALEETLRDKADITDGAALVRRIIGRRTYQSITGSVMNIDSNGDVEGNYSVLALRDLPQDIKLRIDDDLNKTMLPVCNFFYDNDTLLLSGTLDWSNPPVDEPSCYYDGSNCRKEPKYYREILLFAFIAVLITEIIVVYQIYRNWRKEKEIDGLLWRLEYDNLEFHSNQLNRTQSKTSFTSQMSSDSGFLRSRNTLVKTASFKGTIVAIKELQFSGKKDKDIPRASKIEMKQIREIRHDNINQFIGACVLYETSTIYIVTEYCSKGSLQDILDNTDVKLDSMFVSSLVFDLISGLNYLHHSEIKFHGNLKTSNCLITSRWVLKITDFGLHNFRLRASSVPFRENMRHTHYRNQLWRAPELLRDTTLIGNQKTDIYAFGIILHEIIGRHGPFGIDTTSIKPEEMVDSIKNPRTCSLAQFKADNTIDGSNVNQMNRSIHRQGSSSLLFDQARSMTRDNSQIDMQRLNNHPQLSQSKGFIQFEQFKNHAKACAIDTSGFMALDVPDNAKASLAPETILEDPLQETPFLGAKQDPKIQQTNSINNNNNNGLGGNRHLDTLILFRPDINLIRCPQYIIDVMRDCWSENPELRPEISIIRRKLERMRQGLHKHNIMDNMMALMEKYSNNLEEIVQERTAQLVDEKKKTEILLHRMLPPSVAEQLVTGEEVEPESFDAVTIFFSDIVGFTELSSRSTPMQVVLFLNDLYTLFDAIIREYSVYKVETIGDAYMVVSGLPERISDHASEIASMAIELLKSVEDFRIRHLPKEILQLRIGLHTGEFSQCQLY